MKKILVIVIIIALALVGVFLFSNKEYSKDDIIKLLEKGDTQNYTMSYSDKIQTISLSHKDDVFIISSFGEEIPTLSIYQNFKDDKILIFNEDSVIKSSISNYPTQGNDEDILSTYNAKVLKSLNSNEYDYKFISTEKNEKEKCVIFNLTRNDDTISNTNYTVGLKSGLIYKLEELNSSGNPTSTIDFDINLNSVSDEDIKEPDISNYEVLDFDMLQEIQDTEIDEIENENLNGDE